MKLYSLKDLHGDAHAVAKAVCEGDLLYAEGADGKRVPIYSIKYDNEFEKFHKDQIENNENLRDCRPSDTEG